MKSKPPEIVRSRRTLILAAVAVLTAVSFLPVLRNGFVNYDDPEYVVNNEHVHAGLSSETLVWSFNATEEANWHPLTWLSHALDWTLFGADPRYHHAMSLLLHLIGTCLLYLLFERMTGAVWKSAFVAIVFGIHPLHVESVAWIAERKDVLSGCFWMMTIAAYLYYRLSPSAGRYGLLAVTFALGLLAKPMLVTLPFVLLIIDFWPLGRFTRRDQHSSDRGAIQRPEVQRAIVEKIPLVVLSLASSIVTYLVQQQAGATKALAAIPAGERIANAVVSYALYLRKSILPTDLAVFYPHPHNIPSWEIAVSLIVLAAITVFVWRRRLDAPYLLSGWLWFLGTLVPVIGLIQVGKQAMADRYMYLPLIGLSVMVAWGVPDLLRRVRSPKPLLRILFALATAGLAVGTFSQASVWRDSTTLFEHAVEVTSNNYIAQNNLGAALADSGRHEEAIVHVSEALRENPDFIEAHHNLARSLAALGRRREALEQYGWILQRVQNDPRLHLRMGELLAGDGDASGAIAHYLEAVRLDPSDVDARCLAGRLYAEQGNFPEATLQANEALRLSPCCTGAYVVLGIAAGKQQKNDEADRWFREAIRCDSANAEAYNDLGILDERIGKSAEAFAMYEAAVRINPRIWNAQFNFGTALARRGDYPNAELHWRAALALNPEAVDARVNLGRLYAMQRRNGEAAEELQEALKIDPSNIQAQFQYAGLLGAEGRFAAAESLYTALLGRAPGFQPAKLALDRLRSEKRLK